MSLTVVDPPSGAPMGYGQAFLAHSSTALVGRETLEATLYWIDAGSVVRTMCKGSGELTSGSGNADIVLGISYFGSFQGVGATDPRGAPLGATLGLKLVRSQLFGPVLETVDVGAYFIHDPVSQSPSLLAGMIALLSGGGHDPMLDDILASVRKTYG